MVPGVTHLPRVSRLLFGARKPEFCLGSMHIRSFRIEGVPGILCRSFQPWAVGRRKIVCSSGVIVCISGSLRLKMIYLLRNGGYTGVFAKFVPWVGIGSFPIRVGGLCWSFLF